MEILSAVLGALAVVLLIAVLIMLAKVYQVVQRR